MIDLETCARAVCQIARQAGAYIREERQIYITVKGEIATTKEDYVYNQTIRVWN